ncbi:MAG: phenylalanine--tRNA ligase subunit alpha [Candidatus Kerfeldbacteria bacterium CG15_BIG_FIL_POST_REV_8_21_14_020_45_12]|uniref:Phenylalanine--tRNA ligase alpha subunit n=1 Tax=Candidatus Kerfeldbacteria bacterium CG15_BIG_FIL_POST_REV_8_21_14_020_45_12 TaxID=2014247 RepID=A0A2M7H4K7_9BACT|nr:MAG: phenylalanine--tRNA ligase subunit alpha [Candidatus Kerfeldbacteria bacterium CG15_BIG_FIL_POST_REV_8_21_14_020_45_12]PJA92915.1 MAG: phenylalanine--tRNA ligase subunit alpha [Candidatus Kerfeldbacteria bacterium CG_4_9_14_3_um_filter_45_8]
MKQSLSKIESAFLEEISQVSDADKIEEIRVSYLGRKAGQLTVLLRGLKDLSIEEKKLIGPAANLLRQKIESTLTEALQKAGSSAVPEFDLSLPGKISQDKSLGHLHPITQINRELIRIFQSMGFQVLEGPELDNDYYNFEGLNFPFDHPARDIQDTFFIDSKITREEPRDFTRNDWVMRTQTSNMQVRVLEQAEPPVRCIIPGRVFRNEAIDATHEHTFYQLEGFVVDENINIGQLVWTLKEIFRQIFKQEVKLRLRPGFFPFVEPGYEVDMFCVFCGGSDVSCKVCKGLGWVEMLGAGMIHPNVLAAAGYDAGRYTGFAFGIGTGRLAMLKYNIPDYRLYMQGDLRFLEQF